MTANQLELVRLLGREAALSTLGSGARELIDLRGEDEVVTGEAGGRLRPGREGGPSPLERHARMVAFRLG